MPHQGIGMIPLDLGALDADFTVTNLHKWLYVPRGCSALHVPLRNQHLIRSSLPTSHGYQPRPVKGHAPIFNPLPASTKSPFIEMFDFVGTVDNTRYLCVPAALKFRQEVCGGEEAIMKYCVDLAREGGDRVASILGTEVMDDSAGTLRDCAFANIRLPLDVGEGEGQIKAEQADLVAPWIARQAVDLETVFAGRRYRRWVRLSAQVFLEMEDFVWAGNTLKELSARIQKGDHLAKS